MSLQSLLVVAKSVDHMYVSEVTPGLDVSLGAWILDCTAPKGSEAEELRLGPLGNRCHSLGPAQLDKILRKCCSL